MPNTEWILVVVGAAFLAFGLGEVLRGGWTVSLRGRTWLKVGAIFLAVAMYLYVSGLRT